MSLSSIFLIYSYWILDQWSFLDLQTHFFLITLILKGLLIAKLMQLTTDWTQIEVVQLLNDGSGLGFGIIGSKSTGVVVKTILPGGPADRVRLNILIY